MNASQAQAAYGTPRMTVGRWVSSGKLAADADGYFEEEDFKALDATRAKKPAPGRKTSAAAPVVKKAAPKKKAPAVKKAAPKKKGKRRAAAYTSPVPASRQEVDLRKALANAKKAEMEVKIKMRDLVSREIVSRVFRKLYAIDSTQWRGLGPRLAPDIMAVGEIENPEIEAMISDRIEREVFRTLSHVKRVMDEFLEEIESEERVGDE